MKTYIQLNLDKTKAHWKFQHDPDTQPPLSAMFTHEIVDLMVDITGIEPEPQEGWLYDGKVFTAPAVPPPPTVDDLLTKLLAIFQSYLNAHYDSNTQVSFIALCVNPATPQEVKDAVLATGNWVLAVSQYYYELKNTLLKGTPWDTLDINFNQFDKSDPKVVLQDLILEIK